MFLLSDTDSYPPVSDSAYLPLTGLVCAPYRFALPARHE